MDEKEKKRKKRKKEKAEKEDKDELEKLLAELKIKRVKEPAKRFPSRRTGGGKPVPKIFGFPHFPRIPSEPKPKINQKLENYGRRSFGWSEPKRPRTEKVIIRNEPDAEQLLKALEKNPKLYDKLSKKLIERMNEGFDRQLEATINDSEKAEKENVSVKDELEAKSQEERILNFEEFAEKYPLEFEGKELLSEDTKQEIMRRAYENYLGNEFIKRLTDGANQTVNKESEVTDKTEKEEKDDSIEDEQREMLESLGITPDEEGKVDLGEVLEKLGEEEGMGIFPLGELEIDEKESEAKQQDSERIENDGEAYVDGLRANYISEKMSEEERKNFGRDEEEYEIAANLIEEERRNLETCSKESEAMGEKVVDKAETVEDLQEPQTEQQIEIETQVEPQLSVLTQLESQDLSSLEAELLQPEIEAEPKIEEAEPEETVY